MTRAMRPHPVPIPLSSLLAPSENAPIEEPLPNSLAFLGPLPPTTPIHLALNYLYLSDLPDFDVDDIEKSFKKSKDRVLIITGPEDSSKHAIKEDDEDYLRERGGEYTFLERLRRVDIRYCPSVKHVMLLLSLLSRGREGSQHVAGSPGLVILWNVGGMLMDTVEADENTVSAPDLDAAPSASKMFNRDATISDYLGIIAAAQASVNHFSSLDTTRPPTILMVFEPDFEPDASLPILRPDGAAETTTIPKGSREKRIAIRTGIERLLGPQSFASVVPAHTDDHGAAVYTLSLARYPDTTFSMRRRQCPRADWYSLNRAQVDMNRLPTAEGDTGGWRWEWI